MFANLRLHTLHSFVLSWFPLDEFWATLTCGERLDGDKALIHNQVLNSEPFRFHWGSVHILGRVIIALVILFLFVFGDELLFIKRIFDAKLRHYRHDLSHARFNIDFFE